MGMLELFGIPSAEASTAAASPEVWRRAQRYQAGQYTPGEQDFLYFGGRALRPELRGQDAERKVLLARLAAEGRGEEVPQPVNIGALADWYARQKGIAGRLSR